MKTVVTGAAGFIGTNLVRRFLKDAREVRAIDNVSRGSRKNLEGLPVEIVHADLRSYEQTAKALEGADCIYHLAARVGNIVFLHGGKKAELEALQSNLAIDTNVLRFCAEHDVKKVVYASSVSVYPIDQQQRIGARFLEPKIEPINPEGGYGWAKLVGEIQLGMMEGCKSAVARIFNAYGEYGEFGATAQVVPALIRKAINYPEEDFVVWGDGNQTRNLIYIADCVEALVRMEEKAAYEPLVLNIGSTKTVSIRELAETIVRASGKNIPLKFDTRAPVGPLSRIPDISKAQEILAWEPRTTLEEGIGRTYEWMKERFAEG